MLVAKNHVSPASQGDDNQRAHAAVVLCSVLEVLRIVAVALKPVVPQLSARMYQQLGFTEGQFQVGPCRESEVSSAK